MHFTKKRKRYFFTLALMCFLSLPLAHGLPIGFGHNQGSLNYEELARKEFIIYHDSRTPHEAQLTMEAMLVGKPMLEKWLQVNREKRLPIIMSAEAAGASFANFITDAIELQTRGMGTRDLAWHELTHTLMYKHLDNILGPAGAIIHLTWMPSWFLEGLAESTSMSIGSSMQSGFERYLALTNQWPSYESLHSLYSGHTDSYLGYALSGAFVGYLLRQENVSHALPELLDKFYYNSMPWMWPWALTPFSPYLPMDSALQKFTQKNGRELYEKYKKAATEHWQANMPGEFLYNREGQRIDISNLRNLHYRNGKLHATHFKDTRIRLAEIDFNPATGWYSGQKLKKTFAKEAEFFSYSQRQKRFLFARPVRDKERTTGFQIIRIQNGQVLPIIERDGHLIDFFETAKTISFIVHSGETFQLCSLRRSQLARRKQLPIRDVLCPLEVSQPKLIDIIGKDYTAGTSTIRSLFIAVTDQSLAGDRYSFLEWQPDKVNNELTFKKFTEKPVAAAANTHQIWLAFSGTSHHTLRKLSRDLETCHGQKTISDIPQEVFLTDTSDLILRLLHGSRSHLLQLSAQNLNELQPCSSIGQHISPMLLTMNTKEIPSLPVAMAETNLWKNPIIDLHETPKNSRLLDFEKTEIHKNPAPDRTPASVRFRPVFAVPWIGGDSGGYNFGILSVPLMDHMQNWTAQLNALYGPESRFPTTILSTYYTGFWPRISMEAFRYQTWNGVYQPTPDSHLRSSFLDERGVRISADFTHAAWSSFFRIGLKSSELKPYIGPAGRHGHHNELFLTVSKSMKLGSWNWVNSLDAESVSELFNGNLDYNSGALNSQFIRRYSFWQRTHRLSMGLNYKMTRGKKLRRLNEHYRPLRIFIPDGGGGLNNITLPVLSGGGLFAASFGDTTSQARIDYSTALIQNIDTLVRLFYIHQLKLSSFVNYGGAWSQTTWPTDTHRLIAAHGHALDLLFDLKGINFNLGGGTGQVFGRPFEVYFTFGFDQIF